MPINDKLLAYPITMSAVLVGIALGGGIPLVIGLLLPTHWGFGAMYILSFFTGCAVAMAAWQLFQRHRLLGGNTMIAAVIVGSMALTFLALADIHDALVPKMTDVDVTDIAGDRELLVRPLPYTVRADDVVFTAETIHITKYSRYQCVYTYAMPLCSVAKGCSDDYWFAEEFVEEIGSSDVCADVPEPDWAARASAPWLRVEPSEGIFRDLVGRDAVVFTPASEPVGTLGDVLMNLRVFFFVVLVLVSVGVVLEVAITRRLQI